jgi:hypothetical protein
LVSRCLGVTGLVALLSVVPSCQPLRPSAPAASTRVLAITVDAVEPDVADNHNDAGNPDDARPEGEPRELWPANDGHVLTTRAPTIRIVLSAAVLDDFETTAPQRGLPTVDLARHPLVRLVGGHQHANVPLTVFYLTGDPTQTPSLEAYPQAPLDGRASYQLLVAGLRDPQGQPIAPVITTLTTAP